MRTQYILIKNETEGVNKCVPLHSISHIEFNKKYNKLVIHFIDKEAVITIQLDTDKVFGSNLDVDQMLALVRKA